MATGNELGGHPWSKIDFKDNNIIIYDNHKNPQHKPGDEGIYGVMTPGIYTGDQVKDSEYIQLEIGESSTSPDKLRIIKPDISTENLGIYDVFVLTQDEALEARDAYKAAGEFVSSERGRIGAYQNRLAHTVNGHTKTIENTTAANSRIEDTDMAEEITEYTSNNILTQAAQAMLAQAQTNPQNVLNLLQSEKQ